MFHVIFMTYAKLQKRKAVTANFRYVFLDLMAGATRANIAIGNFTITEFIWRLRKYHAFSLGHSKRLRVMRLGTYYMRSLDIIFRYTHTHAHL